MRREHIRTIIHVALFLGFVFLIGGTMGGSCGQPQQGGNNQTQTSPGC